MERGCCIRCDSSSHHLTTCKKTKVWERYSALEHSYVQRASVSTKSQRRRVESDGFESFSIVHPSIYRHIHFPRDSCCSSAARTRRTPRATVLAPADPMGYRLIFHLSTENVCCSVEVVRDPYQHDPFSYMTVQSSHLPPLHATSRRDII